jgi:hypothetical protein
MATGGNLVLLAAR